MSLVVLNKDTYTYAKGIFAARLEIPRGNSHIAYLVPLQKNTKEKDPIVRQKSLKGASSGDLCICENKKNVKIRYTFAVQKPPIMACLLKIKDKYQAVEFFTQKVIQTSSKQKSLKTLPQGTVLCINPTNGEITDVLGNISDAKMDEKITLGRYLRKEIFSEDALMEAASYGSSVDKAMYPDRKDLTELDFITIDPATAKDFDDALYYDESARELYVAIADVSEYVREFSFLDKAAKKRGFSIYFPHKSIPMLPRALSENLCSLNENVDRLVFTFKIAFNESGEITNYELFEAVIRSKKRFCYEEIDEILGTQGGEQASALNGKDGSGASENSSKTGTTPSANAKRAGKTKFKFLFALADLAKILRQKRLKNGYNFSSDEVRFVLGEDLELLGIEKQEQTFSHSLVEECMLAANICASKYYKQGIFRTHGAAQRKDIKEIIATLENQGMHVQQVLDLHKQVLLIQEAAREKGIEDLVDKMIIKSLKRAFYSYDNSGHFGLGFKSYTHFTSPIRRYSDLILHRYLKAIIKQDEKLISYIKKELQTATAIISALEEETSKIEWDYHDFIYARWAQKQVGTECEGYIDSVAKDKTYIVKLSSGAFGAKVFCQSKRRFEVFEKVKVKITGSNLVGARISGEILDV